MYRIPAIKRGILKERPVHASLLWTGIAIVLPIGLRWAIDRGQGGIEFVTIFPAVALAGLFLGWRSAMAVAVIAGIIANRVFREEPVIFYADGRDALMVGLYLATCGVLAWSGDMARRLVREQEAAAERELLLNHELMHRVKNMLATVNALAILSARNSSPDEFVKAFLGRIQALGRATELLSSAGAKRCSVAKLVKDVLAPFHDDGRFRVEGPDCEVAGDSCVPLALALHELCTNASKYGALSAPGGKVTLAWTVGEGEEGMLRFVWKEHDGPPVSPPKRQGMGTQLLRAQRGLDHAELEYCRDGVRCEIRIREVEPRG